MRSGPLRVLCVDDDPDVRELVATMLARHLEEVQVTTAESAADAEATLAAEEGAFDCVVSDYDMAGRDGLELLRAVREEWPDLPFVLFTGKGSEEIASEAITAGVTDYVQKGGGDRYALLANRVREAASKYRTETSLGAERRLFGTVLETSPNGVVLVDDEGQIVYANRRATEILQLDRDEERTEPREEGRATGDPYPGGGESYGDPDWTHVDLGGRYASDRRAYDRVMETGEPVYGVHHALEFPDGTRRLVVTDAAPVRTAGEITHVVVTLSDVTDDERRRVRAERYELLVENSTDAMAVLDDEGTYLLVNEAATALLGVDRERVLGATDEALLPAETAAELRACDRRALADDEAVEAHVELPDGEETRHFEVVHVPHDGGPGGDPGVARVAREVTDRVDRERLLRAERDRLEALATTVAHDARNALQVVEGRLELVRHERPDDDGEGRHLDSAADGVDRLRELVDSLESLRGLSDPVCDPEPVDVGEAARLAWATVEAPEAELRVDADVTLSGDPTRVRTLLENLLRNAVEHGGPEVTVTVTGLPDEPGFAVLDDGPGIPADERDRVTEFGYAVEGGTGLGLGIVAGIAEAHGWRLSVGESAAGGARFEFRPE